MSDLKQAIKQNYIKCAKEPSYFINQFCTIQHPQRGKIKFKLYPFQFDVLDEYQNNIKIFASDLKQSAFNLVYRSNNYQLFGAIIVGIGVYISQSSKKSFIN